MKTPFRIKAFSIHLAISLLIALAGVWIVFTVWYPHPLPSAVGVGKVFLVLLAVDVVLGPLLTLLVAKPGKKSLRFDLGVIAALQLAAYIYGMYTIASGRVQWIVFDLVRFDVVQADTIDHRHIEDAAPHYQKMHWHAPEWIAVRMPLDNVEKNDRLFYELQEGFSPAMRPELYVPLENEWPQIEIRKLPLEKLNDKNPSEKVRNVLAKYPQADGYLPLAAYEKDMAVLLDGKKREVVKIVNLRP